MPNLDPKKPLTKTQLLQRLVEESGMIKAECVTVLDALTVVIRKEVGSTGPGSIAINGLLKIKTVRKPARIAKKGVPNPFKPGELMNQAAKPAYTVVKILPLKALKEMV